MEKASQKPHVFRPFFSSGRASAEGLSGEGEEACPRVRPYRPKGEVS